MDADEITYPAHILVRYKLENALIAGDLQIQDLLPSSTKRSEDLLGLTVPNDSLGCLQDIALARRRMGILPDLHLGAMTAAQLFRAACQADADNLPSLAKGDFAPLRSGCTPTSIRRGVC